MTLTCPICGGKPKRDDRGEEIHGIRMGFWAALKCDCGLRLEQFVNGAGDASDLYARWERMMPARQTEPYPSGCDHIFLSDLSGIGKPGAPCVKCGALSPGQITEYERKTWTPDLPRKDGPVQF